MILKIKYSLNKFDFKKFINFNKYILTMSDTNWANAVNLMITSINSDNNMRDFFVDFIPDDNNGYAWSQNTQYRYYANILDRLTNETGHSGASFACCLRESVNIIRKDIVVSEEVIDSNEDIITLEPIS